MFPNSDSLMFMMSLVLSYSAPLPRKIIFLTLCLLSIILKKILRFFFKASSINL